MSIKKLKDRYNFIQQISGRKGVNVFIGYDEVAGTKLIIKEIRNTQKKKDNDFSVLRKLRHPGLPVITDAFEINEALYIIIGFVDGKNISEIIKSRGCFSEADSLNIIFELLDILDYLHSVRPRPVIHGDIKPENIIIKDGHVVLIDFGSVGSDDSSSGFCAPERFAGIPKSVESDIYSVGELLHFLLSGNIKKIYGRNQSDGINDDLYMIISKCTRKLPGDRYHKASAASSELRRVKELRNTRINSEKRIKIVCIPGCPEAACEIAFSISMEKRSVLIADLDMLSPAVHTVMGVDKFSYCLQDLFLDNPAGLINKSTTIKKSGIRMLPCRMDYENYENSADDCFSKLLSGANGHFDIMVISCSGFPYDKYFLDSLLYSDAILFPVTKGIIDIRRYNSFIRFICSRQDIPGDKMFFMGVDTYEKNISHLIASGAVETTWIGSIPRVVGISELYSSGSPYIFSVSKKVHQHCIKMIKKTGVLS